MHAAILEKPGGTPSFGTFDDPAGNVVEVSLAGCNPDDLAMASGKMGTPTTPSVGVQSRTYPLAPASEAWQQRHHGKVRCGADDVDADQDVADPFEQHPDGEPLDPGGSPAGWMRA